MNTGFINMGFAIRYLFLTLMVASPAFAEPAAAEKPDWQRVKYNHPGLVVDLGVGLWAWPQPMDYDGDGDHDLVVLGPDRPYNGIYFFENTEGQVKMPVFKAGVRISRGIPNLQPSYVNGQVRLLSPGTEYLDFRNNQFTSSKKLGLPANVHNNKVRANQWKYADFDGDDDLDLVVGVGDWTDYGWDNAFDKTGTWTHGPLHGYVYLLRNQGTADEPKYAEPVKIPANGNPIDVYGMPSPNLADFDGDGDLDMICGEFVDKFTWFENTGTRTEPRYAEGKYLTHTGKVIQMDLCMMVPVAMDWDRDGDVDLIVGQEDGRVAFMEHTGEVIDGMPQCLPPRFFQQQADDLKFGALATPFSFDWDGDGDEDLICGNTAGYIGFIENLDGGNPPQWAEPKYLEADHQVIRIMAGPNGSIQGPCEAKWGYTVLNVADWDQDGLPDLVVNSIWGKVVWYQNIGTRTQPRLAAARPIEVEWAAAPPKPAWNWWEPAGKSLATQWRTSPVVLDYNQDGLNDLIMLDHEGYLALFLREKRNDTLVLLPGRRIFQMAKEMKDAEPVGVEPMRLNPNIAGGSGRRKFCLADWDRDGRIDILINSKNIDFLRNVTQKNEEPVFYNMGLMGKRVLAGHTTCPTVVDWNRDGKPDLLAGAEDGRFYYMENPY
ncbi:MAG: FG-GAP repeat protein [Planctomycetes bacterium ADurb.Bin412]|nr:MAG: FG-GAP repeat protein [Planctomycetes bacterium ADurb.Bin412]